MLVGGVVVMLPLLVNDPNVLIAAANWLKLVSRLDSWMVPDSGPKATVGLIAIRST